MPSDTIAALEWQAEQDRKCSGCGQWLDETMRKENTHAYRAEALWCHGCRAIHRAASKMNKSKEDPLAGTRYRVWQATNGSQSSDIPG